MPPANHVESPTQLSNQKIGNQDSLALAKFVLKIYLVDEMLFELNLVLIYCLDRVGAGAEQPGCFTGRIDIAPMGLINFVSGYWFFWEGRGADGH